MTDPRTVIREKVAQAIWAVVDDDPDDPAPWEDCPEDWKQVTREQADAAIAAHLEALEEAARIETVEQLDALGLDSIVRTVDKDVWEKRTYMSGLWDCLTEDGNGGLRIPPLPCRVLYRPGEES